MNNKVNYTLVGSLVLLGVALMIGFTYWLLKPSGEQEMKKYYIHFDESVLGLNVDAPVKYRGINVGKVTSLKINPKNTDQVEVLVTVLETTPVKSNTIAKLTSQGITGLSYINLSYTHEPSLTLKASNGLKYPVIKTQPSFLERVEKSFDNVSGKLSKTLSKTEKLLNDENQEQISLILTRTAVLMNRLDNVFNDENQKNFALLLKDSASFAHKSNELINKETINHFYNISKNLDDASGELQKVLKDADVFLEKSAIWETKISNSLASIMNSYLGIRAAMDEIKKAVASGEFNIKEITSDVIPTLNNTLLDMQQLMIKSGLMLDKYDRSPSDLLFKEEEVKKAPGEK